MAPPLLVRLRWRMRPITLGNFERLKEKKKRKKKRGHWGISESNNWSCKMSAKDTSYFPRQPIRPALQAKHTILKHVWRHCQRWNFFLKYKSANDENTNSCKSTQTKSLETRTMNIAEYQKKPIGIYKKQLIKFI